MPRAQEFEFKFEVIGPPDDVPNPLRTALQDVTPVRLRAIYYETPTGALRAAGLMLRVRSDGQRNIMTMKSDGATPLERGEWEREVPDLHPDLTLLADTPHAETLAAIDAQSLQPRLETDIARRRSVISYKRSEIEVILDEGELRAGDRRLAVHEFELELVRGRRDEIIRYVRELPNLGELRIGLVSKGERGFRLADDSWGHAIKGAPVRLTAEMSAGQSFAAIAHACLKQFALNLPALDHGEDVEGVHQCRVALRRLRAALSLFKALFAADQALPALRAELGWLGELLGRTRDLDVLLSETLAPTLAAEPDAAGLADLARAIEAERAEAFKLLKDALASPRLSRLLLEWTLWLEDGPWRRSRTQAVRSLRDGPIRDFVVSEMGRRLARFCAKADKLEKLSPERLHDERIRAKKLRYGAQFFHALASGGKAEKSARKLEKRLEEVQTALGEIQDAETRRAFLSAEARNWSKHAGGDASMILFAAGRLAATQSDRDALVAQAARAGRKICEMKPFWDQI